MKTRISSLLFADVAGYARLIDADEERGTQDINQVFKEFVWRDLSSIGGRVVQLNGDGFFLEFKSILETVRFAIKLQDNMKEFNASRKSGNQIEFRIGINYGEVVVDEETGRLSGTAVNIASRLENIADVGGIWVSESVVQELNHIDEFRFISLGSRRLKNMPGRIPIYGVLKDKEENINSYHGYDREYFQSEKTTIALLPFKVISQKGESEYLSEAIIEDLSTELSHYTEIKIIAPDEKARKVFQAQDIKDTGRRLGVDYVITGSIMRHGDSIRVHSRLYETELGSQLWAKCYDSEIKDMFELHDCIACDLSSRLPISIENSILHQVEKKSKESLDAFDCYIKGRELYREKSEQTDLQAISYLRRAIKLDPNFADSYAILGAIYGINWAYTRWGLNPVNRILKGRKLIKKAISLNHDLPRAHAHLAWTYLSTGEFQNVDHCFDTALSLNHNDVDILLLKAYAIMYMGRASESIEICESLMELNPSHPDWYVDVLGGAYFIARDYEKGLFYLKKVENLFPECAGWIGACYGYLDQEDKARSCGSKFISRIRSIWKGSQKSDTLEYVEWFLRFACPFKLEQDRKHMALGLFKSGLEVPQKYIEEETLTTSEKSDGPADHSERIIH